MRGLAVALGAAAIGVWFYLFYGDFWNGLDFENPLNREESILDQGVALGLMLAMAGLFALAVSAWNRGTREVISCPRCAQEFPSQDEYSAHFEAYHSTEQR